MFDQIKVLIDKYSIGNIASILSLLIGVVGFTFTLRNVWKSMKAAEKAEKAVENVQKEIRKMDTISEFSAAIATMEEIKRHQRESTWNILPERYSSLRKTLNAIRSVSDYL